MRTIVFGIVIASCLVMGCLGLRPEEAGEYDWTSSNIGKVTLAKFHSSGKKQRVIVATEQNVLAALNARTGDTMWRQVYGQEESIDKLVVSGRYVFTLSGNGKRVHLWNDNDGSLVWDEHVYSQEPGDLLSQVDHIEPGQGKRGESGALDALAFGNPTSSSASTGRNQGPKMIVVLVGNKVVSYRGHDGGENWSWSMTTTGTQLLRLVELDGGKGLGVVAIKDDQQTLVVVNLSLSSGKVVSKKESVLNPGLECGLDVIAKNVAVLKRHVVLFDPKGKMVYVHRFGQEGVVAESMGGNGVEETGFIHGDLGLEEQFLITVSRERSILFGIQSDKPTQVKVIKGYRRFSGQGQLLLSVQVTERQTDVEIVNVVSGETVGQSPYPINSRNNGNAARVFFKADAKQSGKNLEQVLLVTEDHSAFMLQREGSITWIREEALASIHSTKFVELPVKSAMLSDLPHEFGGASVSNNNGVELNMEWVMESGRWFVDEVKQAIKSVAEKTTKRASGNHHHHHHHLAHGTQAKRGQYLVGNENGGKSGNGDNEGGNAGKREGGQDDEQKHSDRTQPLSITKDAFGFRQLVIAMTEPGKIFALHSDNGKIVWKRFFHAEGPGGKIRLRWLFVTKPSVHYPPECVVVGEHQGRSVIVHMDPLTGSEISREWLNEQVLQAMVLPFTLSDHHKIVLLRGDNWIRTIPDSGEAKEIVCANRAKIFLHSVDLQNGQINGYRVESSGSDCKSSQLKPLTLWTVSLTKERERIAAVGYRHEKEVVNTLGKVKPDRSLRYKYHNPNTVVIATIKNVTEREARKQGGILSVYMLDTVTGEILYSVRHWNAHGPIHVVVSENWFAFCLQNLRSHRFEMSVVELYEPEVDWENTTFSSMERHRVIGEQQSFVIPFGVRSMGISATRLGITTKNLLLGLTNGQVMRLDKRILDPSRPLGREMSQQDKEAGVMPYFSTIGVNPRMVITYHNAIKNVRKIETTTTTMESTSLVFVFGLDNFFTRIAPSKTFDMLNAGFNYVFLIMSIIALLVFTPIMMCLARRGRVRKAWE